MIAKSCCGDALEQKAIRKLKQPIGWIPFIGNVFKTMADCRDMILYYNLEYSSAFNLFLFLTVNGKKMYPAVERSQRPTASPAQCKQWQKPFRGKCVCKMPPECRYICWSNHHCDHLAFCLLVGLIWCILFFFIFYQFFAGGVCRKSNKWTVCSLDCVQDSGNQMYWEKPWDSRRQQLQVATAQHHRLHQMSHVGKLWWWDHRSSQTIENHLWYF